MGLLWVALGYYRIVLCPIVLLILLSQQQVNLFDASVYEIAMLQTEPVSKIHPFNRMSQEKVKSGQPETEESSGSLYAVFGQMESLVEKLKLLNYEKEYCRSRHQKPIPRHYFAIPTNPGEQFYTFTTLSAWLIVQANGKIDAPQEFDDPNATIATILDAVRTLGYSVEFPPSKLKSGCGEYCITVLNMLADAAIHVRNLKFSAPIYPEEGGEEFDVEEEDSTGDDVTCEWQGQSIGGRLNETRTNLGDFDRMNDADDLDDDEEDEVVDLEALCQRTQKSQRHSLKPDPSSNLGTQSPVIDQALWTSPSQRPTKDRMPTLGDHEVLESHMDPADWHLEVERVLPQLRIPNRQDAKDWRVHLEQMNHHQTEIEQSYGEVKTQLNRLHDELTRALDKIGSREKYMNSQLEPLLGEYRRIQDNLTEVTNKYRQASTGITERSRCLAEITEELERVKTEMDERGSSMTDGSPVVRIKQAIQRLKAEMITMDIRTGVLEHILLRTHLRVREDSQKPLFAKKLDQPGTGTAYVY